jgi:transposase
MEGKKRITRSYTSEFKLEAVRRSNQPDHTVTGVARDLGVPLSVLQGWRRQAKGDLSTRPQSSPLPSDQEARIRQLERELEIARQERDILEKATAFFARKSR